jgi:RimJ/RimL family protein N-acetyltransferase
MSEKFLPRRRAVSGETIEIRMGVEQDIDVIMDYWYGMDDTALRGMGVDPQRMPPRSEFHRLYVQMARSPPESSDAFFFVIDSPTRGILGYSLFNHFERPEHCYGHAHLFHDRDRNRGIARSAFILVMQAVFELTGIRKIVAEPKATNESPNRLMQSLGLKPVRTYDKPAGGIVGAMRVNRYEITPELVFRPAP